VFTDGAKWRVLEFSELEHGSIGSLRPSSRITRSAVPSDGYERMAGNPQAGPLRRMRLENWFMKSETISRFREALEFG
jgi:hypothetical protein